MSEGNSNTTGEPAGLSAPEIMSHVGGPFEPTVQVLSDPFNTVDPFTSRLTPLSGAEGVIMVQTHVIHDIPVTEPAQDIAGARDAGAK